MSAGGETGAFAAAAEEATKLVDALGEWFASHAGGLNGFAPNSSADCRLCPVCQLIRLLRQARPEIVEHLDDAVGSLLAAARIALETGERASETSESRTRAHAGRAAGFEHIDIG